MAVKPPSPSVKVRPRAEALDKATKERFDVELDAALKRKPANEVKLAGALRALAELSPALRGSLVEAAQTMVRRGSYSREIYGVCLRSLAEAGDRNIGGVLKTALAGEDAGGTVTMSAACFCKDASLTAPLAKLASSRQSHLAFGAETARVCRSESNGAHLASLAPMIKESHRISLCAELFVPLARAAPSSIYLGAALGVLRGAERHLGRWLVLADVAVKAGDLGPLQEATAKASIGPSSSRVAWSLVAWALSETRNVVVAAGRPPSTPGGVHGIARLGLPPIPLVRPTVELVARLSDRPSADRDTTFLFRLARARSVSCKAMLEGLTKALPLSDEVAVRAASYLARDHARADLVDALADCAQTATREELRGVAVAALWDSGTLGSRERARALSDDLVDSPCLSNVAWGALVRAAHAGATGKNDPDFVILSESAFRWIHWGWLE